MNLHVKVDADEIKIKKSKLADIDSYIRLFGSLPSYRVYSVPPIKKNIVKQPEIVHEKAPRLFVYLRDHLTRERIL